MPGLLEENMNENIGRWHVRYFVNRPFALLATLAPIHSVMDNVGLVVSPHTTIYYSNYLLEAWTVNPSLKD